jgi:hypothetical protein
MERLFYLRINVEKEERNVAAAQARLSWFQEQNDIVQRNYDIRLQRIAIEQQLVTYEER